MFSFSLDVFEIPNRTFFCVFHNFYPVESIGFKLKYGCNFARSKPLSCTCSKCENKIEIMTMWRCDTRAISNTNIMKWSGSQFKHLWCRFFNILRFLTGAV